jgi:hypothetical protein
LKRREKKGKDMTPEIPWEDIGHTPDVVGLTAINGKLFCATRNHRLLWRGIVDSFGRLAIDTPWEDIGHAPDVVGLTVINDKLFCATRYNRLLWRDSYVLPDFPWEDIGHATDVVGMAATNDTLYCATRNNRLWRRPAVGREIGWV